jgi:hypothetical protein
MSKRRKGTSAFGVSFGDARAIAKISREPLPVLIRSEWHCEWCEHAGNKGEVCVLDPDFESPLEK